MKKIMETMIICTFAVLLVLGGTRSQNVLVNEEQSFQAWTMDMDTVVYKTYTITENEKTIEWWRIGPDGKELTASLTIKSGGLIYVQWKNR